METRGAPRCYLHINEILVVLVVFGEVGLNELLSASEGFVPTATEQRNSKEAEPSGNQRGKGCPDEAAGTALQQTCGAERGDFRVIKGKRLKQFVVALKEQQCGVVGNRQPSEMEMRGDAA